MHAFVDNHLIVLDPFGLTRVTLPNKVKSNRKVNGELVKANGKLLVGHSNISNRGFAMTVPELKVISLDNYSLHYKTTIAVSPSGLPVELDGDVLFIYDMKGNVKHRLERPKAKSLGKVELGPAFPTEPNIDPQLAVGSDGTFVVFANGALSGGKLVEGKRAAIADAWSATVAQPQGQRSVKAGAWGAFASTFQRSQRKAYCVHVANGTPTQKVVDCVGPVDFDGANIVYQASPTEVCRMPIRGGAPDRFELPNSAHGIGTVMADGEHLLFLTPDHERILDVANDEAIDRGLPATERALRTKLLAFVRGYEAPAARANLWLRMTCLRPPAYGMGPRPQWDWDAGDHGILRLIVIGDAIAAMFGEDPELSPGSYGNPLELAQVTEAGMLAALEAVDADELDLVAGLGNLASPMADYYDARFGTPKRRPPRFDKGAAQMLLWAIVEAHGAKRQPKLAAKAAKWAKQPITAKQLIDKLDPSQGWDRGHMIDPQTSVAWLVVDYLQDDAFDVMFDWLIERPSPHCKANFSTVAEPAKALMKLYPKQGKQFRASVEAFAKSESDGAERAANWLSYLD